MQFMNLSNGWTQKNVDFSSLPTVVDVSSYRPDAEQVRAMKFNPVGSSATPLYDYSDGKVPKDDPATLEIVALRSGKLDRADVDRIKANIEAEARENTNNVKLDKLADSIAKTFNGVDAEK